MQEWFVGRGTNELSERLGALKEHNRMVAAVVEVTSVSNSVQSGDAVFYYAAPYLTLEPLAKILGTPDLVPLIEMHDESLPDAIRDLARAAGIPYEIDPKVSSAKNSILRAEVSIRWENVTPTEGLLSLLHNYGLRLVRESSNQPALITEGGNSGEITACAAVRSRIQALLQPAFESTKNPPGPSLKSARLVTIATKPGQPPEPVHIVLRAEKPPAVDELKSMFRSPAWNLSVAPKGTNRYELLFDQSWICATDYLAWSDTFEGDFNLIREALKRPYARMDGDYSRPAFLPIPKFMALRVVAQTLADRARCHFLLGEPDKALSDVKLMHDLCRVLEIKPTGQPLTLVGAMINVAIHGLYAETLADGFNLNAWQEPHLRSLEKQLDEINLPPIVASSFVAEPAAECESLLNMPRAELVKLWKSAYDDVSPKWPLMLLRWMPRGWVYQTMVVIATSPKTNGVDVVNKQMFPRQLGDAMHQFHEWQSSGSPIATVATMYVPNWERAWKTTMKNQMTVDEARVACALQRYRLAHGTFPETLDVLVPEFIQKVPHDVIGGQPLHYRRTGDSFTLYSVAWNEADDGGKVLFDKTGKPEQDQLDWVWPSH
jgi:hypothetical protein